MEEFVKLAFNYGIGTVLVGCLVYYHWHIVTKVLPKQYDDSRADLKSAHERCEEALNQKHAEFIQALGEQRAAGAEMVGKLMRQIESLDSTIQGHFQEVKR